MLIFSLCCYIITVTQKHQAFVNTRQRRIIRVFWPDTITIEKPGRHTSRRAELAVDKPHTKEGRQFNCQLCHAVKPTLLAVPMQNSRGECGRIGKSSGELKGISRNRNRWRVGVVGALFRRYWVNVTRLEFYPEKI